MKQLALSMATALAAGTTDLLAGEPVTVDNFVRAESDHMIRTNMEMVGVTFGKFAHLREPTTPDNQPVIRMNQDTLYSATVLDLSRPVTITLPELDGSHRYTLRFAPGRLPPVNSFWSLTMYELPESLLVENPINRYLVNSPMLDDFVRDEDRGSTLYLQHDSPGEELEPNWLPTPKGSFSAVMRLYWPQEEALDGTWDLPPLVRVR